MKVSEVLRLLHDDGWSLVCDTWQPPAVQAPVEAWPGNGSREAE
jgi:hypothetical protein